MPCTGVGTPAGCDTAIESVTLTVRYPAAKIAGNSIQEDIDAELLDIGELARSTSGMTSTKTVDLYEYFSPTGGLTFAVDSSNEDVLTVSETGGVLTLTATQFGGTSTVMVEATNDPDNLATFAAISTTVSDSFMVTVTPTADPVFNKDNIEKGNIEALSKGLTVDDAVTVRLGYYFSDADTGESATLRYELVDADADSPHTHTYQENSTDVPRRRPSPPPTQVPRRQSPP